MVKKGSCGLIYWNMQALMSDLFFGNRLIGGKALDLFTCLFWYWDIEAQAEIHVPAYFSTA